MANITSASITLRATKGSPLTNTEVDNNFSNINTALATGLTAASYTAADVLSKLNSVSGPTQAGGLNADTMTFNSGARLATNANTANTIVARDASGNFSAGTITGNLTGTASVASSLNYTVAVAGGGTGQSTANAALNALLPSQATYSGRSLVTDGTNTSWTQVGTVYSVGMTVPAFLSITGTPVTGTGTLAIGLSGTPLPIANGGTNSTATATAGGVGYGTGTAHAYTAAGTSGQILTSAAAAAPTWITTLPIANGGTNSTATPTAGGAGYGTGTAYAVTAAGTSGQPLISAGAAAPAFGALAIGTANTNISGVLTATNGGTGVATLSGIAYGNGTSAFTAATSAQVRSVIGTVPIANGGTNSTATPTAGGVGYGTGTAFAFSALGTAGQVLQSNGSGAPSWLSQASMTIGNATNATNATNLVGSGSISGTTTGVTKAYGTSDTTMATTGFVALEVATYAAPINSGSSFTNTGYQKLASGLIIQWGQSISATTPTTINFAINFPNTVLNIQTTPVDATGTCIIAVDAISVSGFTANKNYAIGFYWMAIGY